MKTELLTFDLQNGQITFNFENISHFCCKMYQATLSIAKIRKICY